MKLTNLTPHTITLRQKMVVSSCCACGHEEGTCCCSAPFNNVECYREVVLPSEGLARISSIPGQPLSYPGMEDVGIPIYGPTAYGQPEGLPDPESGTLYIVSALLASRVPQREDVVYPGTGPNDGAIRYPATLPDGSPHPQAGQVQAVTRLIRA